MNLTPVFARTQGQEENSLQGHCFKEASLRGSNGALPIGATPGRDSRRDAPPTLRSVSVNCPRDEQDSCYAEIYWGVTQLSAMTDQVDHL